MLELGKFTEEAHREVGGKLVGVADILVTVGPRSRSTAEGAIEAGFDESQIKRFDTAESAAEYLHKLVRQEDIVLIKGSQGVRLERAVLHIMDSPELASQLLARQEKEWEKR